MPPNPPEAWPPPISTQPPSEEPILNDPAKTARQYAALGWIFLGLSLAAPSVFLPYAIYYGQQARRRGEAAQGSPILLGGVLLTAALTALWWSVMKG